MRQALSRSPSHHFVLLHQAPHRHDTIGVPLQRPPHTPVMLKEQEESGSESSNSSRQGLASSTPPSPHPFTTYIHLCQNCRRCHTNTHEVYGEAPVLEEHPASRQPQQYHTMQALHHCRDRRRRAAIMLNNPVETHTNTNAFTPQKAGSQGTSSQKKGQAARMPGAHMVVVVMVRHHMSITAVICLHTTAAATGPAHDWIAAAAAAAAAHMSPVA